MSKYETAARDFGAVTVGKNGRQLQFAFVEVTPELAVSWLNLNAQENKRHSKKRDVDYSGQMQAGLWNALTGECIKFGRDGCLYDGGHRLRAIIAAGKSQTLLICWGIPPEAFHIIDQGWSRPRLWWEKPEIRATVQMLARMRGGEVSTAAATPVRLKEVIERHRNAIQFSCDCMATKSRAIATADVRAIIARATYYASAELLCEFAAALYTRELPSTPNRQFVMAKLVAFLVSNPVTSGNTATRYRKTERAVKAFIDDAPITKLYEANCELFPLPEEVA